MFNLLSQEKFVFAEEDTQIRNLLRPNLMIDHLFEIPLIELKKEHITGIVFDLDNTIIAWSSKEMEQTVIDWLSHLKDQGFKLCIVSNSMESRVSRIAQKLMVPYIARACKPMGHGFHIALKKLNLQSSQVAVIGDQLFTDVFGGNRMGAFTILVKPLGSQEFIMTKLTRILEKIVLKMI